MKISENTIARILKIKKALFLFPIFCILLITGCSNSSEPAPEEEEQAFFPPPLFASGITYDKSRSSLLVYGGQTSSGVNSSSTYKWGENRWLRHSVQGPSARFWTSMVYNDARQKTILFGGVNSSALNDTWEYDGNSWQSVNVSTRPPARYAHEMAYDSQRNVVLLFGGTTGSTRLADLWSWNGTQWSLLSNGGQGPVGRAAFGMAYDSSRDELIVYGGFSAASGQSVTQQGDTWAWNGSQWILKAESTTGLGTRDHVAMAYDAARQRVVLYGGVKLVNSQPQEQNDTWEWDGQSWTLMNSNGPSVQSGHRIIYHAGLQKVVLWTGNESGSPASVLWIWNGQQWQVVQ